MSHFSRKKYTPSEFSKTEVLDRRPVPLLRGAWSMFRTYLCLLRPLHCTKSILAVLIGPLFLLSEATLEKFFAVALTVIAFVIGSSAVYVLNDLCDVRRDRYHPTKCSRPLASGEVNFRVAGIILAALFVLSLSVAVLLPLASVLLLVIYTLLNIGYSLGFKHVPILEILVVSSGFALRTITGFIAFEALPDRWVLGAVVSGSLLLTLGKRRQEMADVKTPWLHRPVLARYSGKLLDIYLVIAATALLGTGLGAIYKFFSGHGLESLFWLSVPFFVYLLKYYLMIALVDQQVGNPMIIILTNTKVIFALSIWFLVVLIGYLFPKIFIITEFMDDFIGVTS